MVKLAVPVRTFLNFFKNITLCVFLLQVIIYILLQFFVFVMNVCIRNFEVTEKDKSVI